MKKDRQHAQPPSLIEDRQRRINIKSKRRRNFLKKAIELKAMCGLEMLVVIKDSEFGKVHVYNMMRLENEANRQILEAVTLQNSSSETITKLNQFKV